MLLPGHHYKIVATCFSDSNELGIMSYYGLVTGALFNVTSLYKKRGMAVIMVHQQKLLVRLADLSCLSFVQES